MRQRCGIGIGNTIRNDYKITTLQGLYDFVGVRHTDDGIGPHDPHGFYFTVINGIKQVDSGKPGFRGNSLRIPKSGYTIYIVGIGKVHVRGKLMSQTTDFATTHGIRLTG